jgi:hypothetical protein
MNSNKNTARIAGLLYLLVAVFYGFSHFFRVSLAVPGDAGATANNIMASEWLFRIAFVSGLIGQLCFILLGLALYVLLKPVNRNLALLMVIFVLVSVPIAMLNLLNQFAALLLLSGANYLAVFEADQLHALVMLFLDLLDHGTLIAQIFWGIWLLPLGYLVFKSGFLPKILGILLMIATFGYVVGSFASFLFPNYDRIIELVYYEPAIAEILFVLWLLIRGVNESKLKPVSAGH